MKRRKKNTTEQRILTTKKNNSILFKYSKDVTKKKSQKPIDWLLFNVFIL